MSRRTTWVVGWTAAVVMITACSLLGQWQLTRMHDKRAMLDAVAAVLETRTPLTLSRVAGPGPGLDYAWASGAGRFLAAPAYVLDNQIHDGRPGLRVYRLFAPQTGAPLLVDLGWTPVADRVTRLPDAAIVRGDGLLDRDLEIRGLLAPPPSAGLALGPALVDGPARLMTRFDADAIAADAGLAMPPRRVLRLDPTLDFGYARDLDVLPNTLSPDKHLGYAVQWFGLALAALVIALVLTVRNTRR